MSKFTLSIAAAMLALTGCASSASGDSTKASTDSTSTVTNMTDNNSADNVYIDVETTLGSFTVMLYGDTPKHRDNFVKLVKEGYYDGTLFHRVINEFMVQAGDPDSKTAKPGQALGSGGPDYTIDAEIVYPKHFHKRGALAAARQGDQVNPMKASSGSQFYIVTGKRMSEAEMENMESYMTNSAKQSYFGQLAQQHMAEIRRMQQANDNAGLQALQDQLIEEVEKHFEANPVTITPEIKQAYSTVGGTPHLDNNYTVFGEVVKGMDTIDKIEKVQTNNMDRPNEDISIITMKIVND